MDVKKTGKKNWEIIKLSEQESGKHSFLQNNPIRNLVLFILFSFSTCLLFTLMKNDIKAVLFAEIMEEIDMLTRANKELSVQKDVLQNLVSTTNIPSEASDLKPSNDKQPLIIIQNEGKAIPTEKGLVFKIVVVGALAAGTFFLINHFSNGMAQEYLFRKATEQTEIRDSFDSEVRKSMITFISDHFQATDAKLSGLGEKLDNIDKSLELAIKLEQLNHSLPVEVAGSISSTSSFEVDNK
jgi:hypothetical protein